MTARLARGFSPHEDHLTSLLAEMLDDNLTALSQLSFPLTALRAALAKEPRTLAASLSVEARQYPPHIERRLTSSDIGVIVSYRDHLVPKYSFDSGALFQAKRLFPSKRTGETTFSLLDRFESFDPQQLFRLTTLGLHSSEWRMQHELARLRGGKRRVGHYLFYCPRPEAYSDASREEVHRYLISSEGLFNNAMRLHRYELSSDPERHVPGLIATGLDWLVVAYLDSSHGVLSVREANNKPTARDVFQRMWEEAYPLSWFLVYGMLFGNCGSSEPDDLARVRGQIDAADTDAPILPRYVITLAVDVGSVQG
ncbi:MAG: hypothetical protein U0821_08920 [Chloroflexota bacterium]